MALNPRPMYARYLHQLLLGAALCVTTAIEAGPADITSTWTWEVTGDSVKITVGRITNDTTARTTGTLHVGLRFTSVNSPTASGYNVARHSLGQRLGPGRSFSNISFTTVFTRPPPGTYYVHLFVVEYPNLNTILDSSTDSERTTVTDSGKVAEIGTWTYAITGDSVKITVGRITNDTTARTTGTLHVGLRFTSVNSPTASGYNVARHSLGQRLGPGRSFSNISFTTVFTRPPQGTYYVHLFVVEYPNLNTILDASTASERNTVSDPGKVADIEGRIHLVVKGNTATVDIERIKNNSTGHTSGTISVTLQFTPSSDLFGGNGYQVAKGRIVSSTNGTLTLKPGQYVPNVKLNLDYARPPAGVYYAHIYTTNPPDVSKVLDHRTFDGRITVGVPDLVVESPGVAPARVEPGASLTFSARVRNRGDGAAEATTLRYRRSIDATISTGDLAIGTDPVGRLAAGASSSESINLSAPNTAGTYYYGACVDNAADESDVSNNCSVGVRVTVEDATSPDLVVESPGVAPARVEPGASLTFSARVRNRGDGAAEATTLRYRRSIDATVSTGDLAIGTDPVGRLAAGASSSESINLSAPNTAGTYYYGACVDNAADESDVSNNCSVGVRVTVEDATSPDLVVESPGVAPARVEPGASLTFSARVRNRGDGAAEATTLRYRRSIDATVSTGDLAIGTDPVGRLAAGASSSESINLSAPNTAGTYYYGACVDAVADESNVSNNCSVGVRVTVDSSTDGGGGVTPSLRLGDLNGDRYDDVLLRHVDSGAWIYYAMDRQSGTLHRNLGLTTNLDWTPAGVGDLDRDGYDDVLMRHATNGQWLYYRMDGLRGRLVRNLGLTPNRDWRFAGLGDLDGGGYDDVLLRHTDNGEWIYYAMDGERGRLVRNIGATPNRAWVLAGVGDVSGDGHDDLLLRHTDNGQWLYYDMSGRRARLVRLGLTPNRDWRFAGLGDLDGDGDDDVLLRHADNGEWIYYAMDGERGQLVRSFGVTANRAWVLAGIGDVSGDGHDDLVLRHTDNGQWIYYDMSGGRARLVRNLGLTPNRDWTLPALTDPTDDGNGNDTRSGASDLPIGAGGNF